MTAKHKLAKLLLALTFLLGLSMPFAPAALAAPKGTCEEVTPGSGQSSGPQIAACTKSEYKLIENANLKGVTKSNEDQFCYTLTTNVKTGTQVAKTDCSILTLTGSGGGNDGSGSSPGCGSTGSCVSDACTADATSCTDPALSCSTTGNNQCDFIGKYVNPLIDLFSIVFGLVAVISLILGAISYSTSEGDPQKSSKAKRRVANTIIAIVAYMFLYAFLQFIVPGGLFTK